MENYMHGAFPVLWFLLLLAKDINARNMASHVTLTVHKPPGTIYANHPIQVQCSGWSDQKSAVHIEFYSGVDQDSPHIGTLVFPGSRYIRDPFSLDMEFFFRAQEIRVEGVNDRLKQIVTVKLCPQEILHNGYITCFTADDHDLPWAGLDTTLNQYGRLQFQYAQGPSVPRIQIHYHLKRNVAILGEQMRVSCSALVGVHGRLVFGLVQGGKTLYWVVEWNKPEPMLNYGFQSQIITTKGMTKLGPKILSTLFITITKQLQGAKFYCFSKDAYSNKTSNEESLGRKKLGHPLRIKDIKYRPTLRVTKSIKSANRQQWLVEGWCGVPTAFAQNITVVVKVGVMSHLVTVTGNENLAPRHIARKSSAGQTNMLNAFSYDRKSDFKQSSGRKWLALAFFVDMKRKATLMTVSCIVRDIQRCQIHRQKNAMSTMTSELNKTDGLPALVKIEVFLVLGAIASSTIALLFHKVGKVSRRYSSPRDIRLRST